MPCRLAHELRHIVAPLLAEARKPGWPQMAESSLLPELRPPCSSSIPAAPSLAVASILLLVSLRCSDTPFPSPSCSVALSRRATPSAAARPPRRRRSGEQLPAAPPPYRSTCSSVSNKPSSAAPHGLLCRVRARVEIAVSRSSNSKLTENEGASATLVQ
jgi:hypothetical protein